jgi:signal transduction histidine kinase
MRQMIRDGVARRLLTATFASIVALIVVFEAVDYIQSIQAHDRIQHTTADALHSVELVGRLGIDVEHEHVLLGRHIFESEPAGFERIEKQLDATRGDFQDAAREYAPLAVFPGEPRAWYDLLQDISVKDRQVADILALSRQNRDAEAHVRMAALEPQLAKIERDVSGLVELNAQTANRAFAETARMSTRVMRFRTVLGAVVLALLVLTGTAVTRTIARSEERLHRQKLELENKNRELDAFAGRVAHDLKGPLSTINMAASLLAEKQPQQTTSRVLSRGVAQMANIVDELLALSRAGAMPGAIAHTEPVGASLASELAPVVESVGGKLRVELAPAAVQCSEGLLRQALWNLGENAFKYRRNDIPPEIAICGRITDHRYRITCADNGLGMSTEDAEKVFTPFFRGERTRSIAGTGLGLAIVRRVIDAAGGTVAVRSQLGRGTTFELTLPLAFHDTDRA